MSFCFRLLVEPRLSNYAIFYIYIKKTCFTPYVEYFSVLSSHLSLVFHAFRTVQSRNVALIYSVCLWLYSPLLGFGRFFSFFILHTVGMTSWTSDQSVARPLPTHSTAQTQNELTDIHASSGI
jgi:hypothetical protein